MLLYLFPDIGSGHRAASTFGAIGKVAESEKNAAALEKFQTQADVLVNTHEAAILLGTTPTDRPEDVEISPFDSTIYIAHTNNSNHGISMVILLDL